VTKRLPDFTRLDRTRPEIAILIDAMLRALEVVASRPWSTSQEPISDYWWADVLADPRARRQRASRRLHTGRGGTVGDRDYYTLADEPRSTILVACSKCPWKAAFSRADLIIKYGVEYPLPNLLDHLAMPGCSKIQNQWDRCGVYYVNPIGGRER
jgi:hypothetical protein